MVKSAVQVIVRTRPTDKYAFQCLKLGDDAKSVSLFMQKKKRKDDFVNNQQENYHFKYDTVLHNSTQETVYATVGNGIVRSVLEGYNGTIMAYGQTGAGKTYTMAGGTDFKQRGVIPRAISQVFAEASARPEQSVEVRVSYLEIYNEKLYDLLADAPEHTPDLLIQEDDRRGIVVKGLTTKLCAVEAEALSHFFEGNTNRAVAEHQLNSNSTRSHTVFTIWISSRSRVESEGRTTHSKLNCVDLAGSERLSKTGSEGSIMKEAMYINKSLTFLEQVVIALSSQARDHVPYRQSKLTNMLKDSLGGNCKTCMIANIWAEEAHLEETSSTLKFASRMMRITNEITINVTIDPEAQIRKMAKEIAELKSELQMQNQLHGKSHITYNEEFTDDEKFELQKYVRDYLDGRISDPEVKSIRQVKEIFRIFKLIFDSSDFESTRGRTGGGDAATIGKANKPGAGSNSADDGCVGEIEDSSGGVGIGLAIPAKFDKSMREGRGSPTSPSPKGETLSGDTSKLQTRVEMPNRNQAFIEFKQNLGVQLADTLAISQQSLKEKKKHFRDLATQVNDCKAGIDDLRMVVERFQQTEADDDVVDAEYFQALTKMKLQKSQYRQAYDAMQASKAERDYDTRLVEQSRQKLITEFTQWFDGTFGAASGSPHTMPPISNPSFTTAQPIRSGGYSAAARAGDDEDDLLDEGERFENLQQQRVVSEDPESSIYYSAKKAVALHQKTAGGARGPIRRNR